MMLCIIFWIALAAGAQTLTIDSQLGTSIEDCFDRILIAGRLPPNAIYRNASELTTRECELLCKQDKQCQSYDYGVGAKGNSTCNLSNLNEKEIRSILQRHPDYDVYIRLIQCEQPPPKPLQTPILDDEEIQRPVHRPIYRPVVEDDPLPNPSILSDENDLRPYESSHDFLGQRKPWSDRDHPVSYGEHHAQDTPYRPEQRPNKNKTRPKPDSHDVLHFQGYRPGFWSPAPYSPYLYDDPIPFIPNYHDQRPYYHDSDYHYYTKPNRRPVRPGNRPESIRPDPIDNDLGHPYGSSPGTYQSKPERPHRPYPEHNPANSPDNHIYLEIYDPPRPYRPSKPRPQYDQGSYGSHSPSSHGSDENNYYRPVRPSYDQSNYNKPARPERPDPDLDQGYPRPEPKPTTSKPQSSYGSQNYGFGDHNHDVDYQKPKPTTSKPQYSYGIQNYGSGDQNTYPSQTNYDIGYQRPEKPKPTTSKPQNSYGDQNYYSEDQDHFGYQRPERPKPTSSKPQTTFVYHEDLYPNYSTGLQKPGSSSYLTSSHSPPLYGSDQSYYDRPKPRPKPSTSRPIYVYHDHGSDQGYGQRPNQNYGNTKPDASYQDHGYGQRPDQNYNNRPDISNPNQQNGYGQRPDHNYGNLRPDPIQDYGYGRPDQNDEEGYKNTGNYTKPVYESEKDRPYNVPNYIVRPNGDVITSRPVIIGDYGAWRNPGAVSYKACFRRVVAGKRAVRSHVRRVITCERLEDCRRECATERRFHCESFNYRLDTTFRGKGLCELMTKPIEALDIRTDFIEDKDFDFYELDRNSLEPDCLETLKGPGLLHSGYLSSRPAQNTIQPAGHQKRWDNSYGYQGFRPYEGPRYRPPRRRYEEYIPYQIGIGRSNDHDFPPHYGSTYYDSYYKDRKDYANSVDYYQLPEETPGRKDCCSQSFDYHSLGRGNEPPKPYSYGSGYGHWRKGTLNNSRWSGLDYGETKYFGPGPKDHGHEHGHIDHGYKEHGHVDHGYKEHGHVDHGYKDHGLVDHGYKDNGGHGYKEHGHGDYGHGTEVHDKDCSSVRRPGMSLGSGAIRRSLLAQNVVECESACFNEHEFKCVSYSYRYSNVHNTDNCFLSERPYVGQQLLTDSGSDVYAMPEPHGCTVSSKPWVESECFWHVRSGAAVSGPAVQAALTVTGLGACEAECIRAHGFFCRGFSFRFDSPTIGDELENCILTSLPPTTLDPGSLRPTKGHEIYARGNYGRGCEPALHDDVHRETQCYLQYDNAAKLIGTAIKGEARVRDEEACGVACTDAPFRCLSFSFNNAVPPDATNCLLSDVRLFDLQRGVDYEHSTDDWLFAFDLFNSRCWRRVKGDRERPPSDLRPDPRPDISGPSGPPSGSGYIPSGPYVPDHGGGPPSGPSGPPGYLPHPEHPPPPPPTGPGFKPSYPPPDPGFKPPITAPDYPRYPDHRPASGVKPYGPGYFPSAPDRPSYPEHGHRPGYEGHRPGYEGQRPGYDGHRPGYGGPGYLPEPRPERPDPPGYLPTDKSDEPITVSWRHYTVSGFPCRAGTTCAQNQVAGHWACEPEGGEVGAWDYCCSPTHRCGYSEGFHKPWCYVGPEHEQWRPCSDKYYPYHQHNVPHPSQGGRDDGHRPPPHHQRPNRPWSGRPEGPGQPYLPDDRRKPGQYLPEGEGQYWDNLYKNGPQAYYDQYGKPLPGYTKVPTQDRPYIRYHHNSGPQGSNSQWQPISSPAHDDGLDPPVPGGLGVARYWPVAYLHKGPPPNMTYFKYNESDQTTTENYLPKEDPRPDFNQNVNKNTGKAEGRVLADNDDDKMNVTKNELNNTTTTTPKSKIAESVKEIKEGLDKVVNTTEAGIKDEKKVDDDEVKGISGKLDDFSGSIEILDIEDAKKGEKQSGEKTLEAEERQIEAIGRLFASRRGGKLLLEKRSQKELESQSIALDKDLINFDFGNKFPADRKGTIQKVTKEQIDKDNYNDKSLEMSETTFVRPPRVLSTTENIRKAFVNGKIFYDATLRDSTRETKSKQLEDFKAPSVLTNQNGRNKNIRARNVNPVRRVRRLYRRKYNPEEVRRRLLERERNKQEGEKGKA